MGEGRGEMPILAPAPAKIQGPGVTDASFASGGKAAADMKAGRMRIIFGDIGL